MSQGLIDLFGRRDVFIKEFFIRNGTWVRNYLFKYDFREFLLLNKIFLILTNLKLKIFIKKKKFLKKVYPSIKNRVL